MVRKLDIQVARRAVAVAFAATLCVFRVFANDGFDDGVDRSDPKFVVAWLVFALAVVAAVANWRRVRWALGAYVAALLNWIVMMLFVPHAKTDPAFIVLGGAMALVYAATVGENRLFKLLRRGSDVGSEGV